MATEHAINTWGSLADFLNQRIIDKGTLNKNDHHLWNKFLHKWSNEDWLSLIEAASELYKQQPQLFQKYHKDAVKQAIRAIMTGDPSTRIMDLPENKATAWKMIMTLREVWNAAQEQPSTRQKKLENLFDVFME
jgi:hypothetical protein